MNLDPIDIFGETIGAPIKRGFTYFMAIVVGGWFAVIANRLERLRWDLFDIFDFIDGFTLPLAMLFTSAGPLVVAGALVFLMTSWRLDWMFFGVVVCSCAFVLIEEEAGLGWLAAAALNAGLAGAVWMYASYRKAKWANELSELRAYNSLRNAMREEMASKGELDDSGEL
ncbi:MAG: hypothetical protein MUF13_07830 [Akkermansiaceae bacterium]|jgi:hypothetical protein|nr:hypothetical protein [Akkermansiaceae bacterium]